MKNLKILKRLNFFNKYADSWDLQKTDQKKIEFLINMMQINEGNSILDVGCGTGVILPFLSTKVGSKGSVTALDFSKKMLDKAHAKYGDLYEYVHSDIGKTSFDACVFDIVVCFSCFPHFSRKQQALYEIFRILNERGMLFIIHATSREHINNFHCKIGGAVSRDMLPNERRMRTLCDKAGFEKVSITDEKDYYFLSAEKK